VIKKYPTSYQTSYIKSFQASITFFINSVKEIIQLTSISDGREMKD